MKLSIGKQLRQIAQMQNAGSPDPAWVLRTRSTLVARAVQEAPHVPAVRSVRERFIAAIARGYRAGFLQPRTYALAARFALVLIVVTAFTSTGWIATVNASLGALPGDALYSVKIAAEKVQVTLVTNKGTKAKLHAEFATRRAEEVVKLTLKASPKPERSKNVAIAVKNLNRELNDVKQSLEEIKDTSSPATALAVAKVVDIKTEEIKKALDLSASSLVDESEKLKETVTDARATMRETSVKTAEIIVSQYAEGKPPISTEEVRTAVEERIRALEDEMTRTQGNAATSTSDVVQTEVDSVRAQMHAILKDAKQLVAEKAFALAFERVKALSELAPRLQRASSTAVSLSPESDASPSTTSVSSLAPTPTAAVKESASTTAPAVITIPVDENTPIKVQVDEMLFLLDFGVTVLEEHAGETSTPRSVE